MRISAKAEYACLAVIELARDGLNGSHLRVRAIADAQGIPERYLLQILLQLKSAGLVQSARGIDGGYQLARRADQISLADVIAAIDGQAEPLRKAGSPAAQALGKTLDKVRCAEQNILAHTTVAQLAITNDHYDWVL